jgi:hypothetical protein
MTVRARLKLSEIRETKWQKDYPGSKTVRFTAQYDSSIEEQRRFQKATPSGFIELQIDNEAALAQFELGADYYVDFSPAP